MKIMIHTNRSQYIGALLSAYTFYENKYVSSPGDCRIVVSESDNEVARLTGKHIRIGGKKQLWDETDLQSFTICRFRSWEFNEESSLMVDPDVFAVAGAASFAGNLPEGAYDAGVVYHSHWRSSVVYRPKGASLVLVKDIVDELLAGYDLFDLLRLTGPIFDKIQINKINKHYNDFDALGDETILMHLTNRRTQPWRAGLPFRYKREKGFIYESSRVLKDLAMGRVPYRHLEHPNSEISQFIFRSLKAALLHGTVSVSDLLGAVNDRQIRSDIVQAINRFVA